MMMRTALPETTPLVDTLPTGPVGDRLLEIDAEEFRACFDRRPFLIGHHLVGHPLLEVGRLMELARALPEQDVEYNAGALPVSCDPNLTPRNGLSIEETIRRIAECKSWMVLKYVENDPNYRDLLYRCLGEVRSHSEAMFPGMQLPQGFVFLSSPGSVTPFHMDPEHNFLLQVQGSKRVHLFDPRDREVLQETDLERFYGGAHRNMPFREEWRSRAWVYDLKPGQGLHFPVTAPHFVEVGPEVSISFSITFRTPDLEQRGMVHNFNAFLRRRGLRPAPLGNRSWSDSLKYQTYRAWRRFRKLIGRPLA